jgi:hypothetical protein
MITIIDNDITFNIDTRIDRLVEKINSNELGDNRPDRGGRNSNTTS